MILFPNAKINLGLNITGRRDDGFHNLESLFLPIGLSDILEVVESPIQGSGNQKVELVHSGITMDTEPESNIISKAYNLLDKDMHLPSVKVSIHKQIPSGTGLGGGSSDAAGMVILLNKLFQLKLTPAKMKFYLEKTGSDCPFFIENRPSFVSGRGEVLQSVHLDLNGLFLVVIVPEIKINTADAYGLISSPGPPDKPLFEAVFRPVKEWRGLIKNDFEKVLFPEYPEFGKIKERLYELGAVYCSLSGSGSALYGLFTTEINPDEHFPGLFSWKEWLQ